MMASGLVFLVLLLALGAIMAIAVAFAMNRKGSS